MKEKRRRLKADIILISALLLAGLLAMLAIRLSAKDGAAVRVSIGGKALCEYSLAKDGEYVLNGGTNILKIEGGQAFVIYADCPDKLCQNAGKIHLAGERIVCLPNKLMIEVVGEGDVDFVS